MTRVGLVLGAGGVVGQAYHAGALAAIEHDLGWDPRSADVIVGSSAGSVTGALLRLGVPASDLAAWAVKAPLSVEGSSVIDRLEANRYDFRGFDMRDWVRPWRMPSPALVRRLLREPWRFRPGAALMTLLPPGRIDITEPAERLDDVAADRWPDGLRVCSVRRDDGRRVVFGAPGSPSATLARAVAASCAIPAVFSPVEIGGVEYIDGGVHSPTNADVLREENLDLVVAISPMSAAGGRVRTADAPVRWMNHRRLERELRSLKSGDTTVVRVEPGSASLVAMGFNPMAADRSDRIILASFLETGAYLATETLRARLASVAR
jgi:NTE family protein